MGKLEDKKGFTLIEMVVSFGLFSIMMTIFMALYMNALKTTREATAMAKAQQEGRIISELINRIGKQSEDITWNGSTLRFTRAGVTYTFYLNNQNIEFNGKRVNSREVVIPQFTINYPAQDTTRMQNTITWPKGLTYDFRIRPAQLTGLTKELKFNGFVSLSSEK